MKKYVFLFLLLSTIASAQQKYLVFFKDKTVKNSNSLLKSSPEFQSAESQLSPESIERRKKVLGNQYIDYDDVPVNKAYVDVLKEQGAQIIWELNWFNAVSCFLEDSSLTACNELPFVKKIEKVRAIKFKNKVEVPQFNFELNKSIEAYSFNYGASLTQYEISEIPILHDHRIAGAGVTIALLDAGFSTDNHRAFNDLNILKTHDFVYGDSDVGNDGDATHGTQVLGAIAGFDDGYLVGPAYKSNFLLAKTENINVEANVEEDNFAAGVQWAEANGADIIGTSLGYNEFNAGQHSYTYQDMDGKTAITTIALEKAFGKGIVTITSAGNEGNNSWKYITSPADGKNTLAVGAVNELNKVASFSSRGPSSDGRIKPEVMAMGVNCYVVSLSKDQYQYVSGTSVASPIVSGIAAQLLSVYPYLTNTQVRDILIESGDNLENPDNDRGYGLVSAKKAIMFPNLKNENDIYSINKIFLPLNQVDVNSVQIHQQISDDQIIITNMQFDDSLIFSHQLNGYVTGDTVRIRFSYKDKDGVERYEPAAQYYKFVYGTKKISLGTDVETLPVKFKLSQNYPNPFNSETTIEFYLPEKSHVSIKIYNVLGQYITTLWNDYLPAGYYNNIRWNGLNNNKQKVSSGVYIYQMQTKRFNDSKKMIYLK